MTYKHPRDAEFILLHELKELLRSRNACHIRLNGRFYMLEVSKDGVPSEMIFIGASLREAVERLEAMQELDIARLQSPFQPN